MIKCKECGAKHYESVLVCSNCNAELEFKARKANTVYCLANDHTITTKRLSDAFLAKYADDQGYIELLKDYTESVVFIYNENREVWKRIN